MTAQIKKGILEICILHLVDCAGEIYGYDLMKGMKVYFPEIDESTFYSILRRLHHNGLTTAFFGDVCNGPPRKYYRITPQGREWLMESVGEWRDLQRIVREIEIK